MKVNEFIHKVKCEVMLSSLDIPLMVDGKSIKEVVLLRDKKLGYYFNIKTEEYIMKTIEERADAYVGHPFEIDEFSSATIKRQAFIDGATEQRKIDEDRFEKWYCKNKCYRRKECLIPLICARLGKIEKEVFGYEED